MRSMSEMRRRRIARIARIKGSAILELAIIGVMFSVMTIFCLNILVLAIGSGVNERACRDAARMAGQASNYSDSLLLAQTAVKGYQGDGYFVSSPVVVSSEFVYNDFGGSPPANTSPYVKVTTSCQIRLPAPIFIYGLNFGNNTNMTFKKTYTFPIVTTAN